MDSTKMSDDDGVSEDALNGLLENEKCSLLMTKNSFLY